MFAEDLSIYFDENELAERVTLDGVDVVGVFDAPFEEVLSVEALRPTFLAPASALTTAQRGSSLLRLATGETFRVIQKQPDETGRVATLVLEATT